MKRIIRIVSLAAFFAIAGSALAQKKHQGVGVVTAVNAEYGFVTLKHEAIKTLGWSGMTMEFRAREKNLLGGLKPGQRVTFEFFEEKGSYIITSIK